MKNVLKQFIKEHVQFLLKESDFSTFKRYLDSSGQTFEEILADLRSKSPDGKGGNAVFYKIPGTDFGIRDQFRSFSGKENESGAKLEPVDDPFEGENVGQAVAQYGDNVKVLRLQKGKPLGAPLGFDKYESDELEDAAQTLKDRILDAASLPVEEYVKLMNKIIKLNDKGYVMDPSKSGNLLVDPESGFGLVDINKSMRSDYFNNAAEILSMITDPYNYRNFSSWIDGWQDVELKRAGQSIKAKIERAAKSSGLPMDLDKSDQELREPLTDPDFNPPRQERPTVDWGHYWTKDFKGGWFRPGTTVSLPNNQSTVVGRDDRLVKPSNFGADGRPIKGAPREPIESIRKRTGL
jgi:hypothetical protein